MADEVYAFQATIPAGTAVASPTTTTMAFPTRYVRRIIIKVPPGPAGKMGFQIASTGNQIIPLAKGTWIITDDEQITWDVNNAIQSGSFQLIGYNTGIYDHTVYVRFEVDVPQLHQGGDRPAMIDMGALS